MKSCFLCFGFLIIWFSGFPQEGKKISGKSEMKVIQTGSGPTSSGLKAAPDLVIKDEKFIDPDNNSVLIADKESSVTINIENMGLGDAANVVARISLKDEKQTNIRLPEPVKVGIIKPNETREVSFPIITGKNLTDGFAEFLIEIAEGRGFDAYPLEMKIGTQTFLPPFIVVSDAVFSTEKGGTIQLNAPIQLKFLVQNIGKGPAKDVTVACILPDANCFPLGELDKFVIGSMNPGESRDYDFSFITNRRYNKTEIPIRLSLSESEGKFFKDTVLTIKLDQMVVAKNKVVITATAGTQAMITKASLTSEVDKNIPVSTEINPNKFALIIGNEDYTTYQTGLNNEVNVPFAQNDARIVKEYAIRTLGIPETNVYLLLDATAGEMNQKIDLVSKRVVKAGSEAQLLFYYAGHGLPDDVTKIPYIIPVDVNGTSLSSAIKLTDVLKRFSETGAAKITILLDACFSGGGREAGLLAARSVKVKADIEKLTGNLVLFASSTGEQSSLPYKEEKHGLFTYFLLKKIKESSGNISYRELADYLTKTVSSESLRINQKDQDPAVLISSAVENTWQSWKLR